MEERVKNLRACNVCKKIKLIGVHGFSGTCIKLGKTIGFGEYSRAKTCEDFETDFKSICNSCINFECKKPSPGMYACSKRIEISKNSQTYTELMILGIL